MWDIYVESCGHSSVWGGGGGVGTHSQASDRNVCHEVQVLLCVIVRYLYVSAVVWDVYVGVMRVLGGAVRSNRAHGCGGRC